MALQYAKNQPQAFMNKITRVAVVGAGGRIGSAIASELVKKGKIVTGLSRADSASNTPSGVKVATISYEDESSIIKALQDQDFLVITLSVGAPRDTHSKLVHAAAKAGIKYIMPNIYGPNLVENRKLGEDMGLASVYKNYIEEVQKLGMHSVCLVCSYWYEWSVGMGVNHFGFDVTSRTGIIYGTGDIKINTSTWIQCGRAVAGLLDLPILPQDENDKRATIRQFLDGTVYISSFLVSQRDMYDSLKRVTGTTDADWTITEDSAERRWKEASERVANGEMRAHATRIYSRIFFDNGDGDYETSKGLANDILGLPKEDLDEATREAIRLVENNELPRHHS